MTVIEKRAIEDSLPLSTTRISVRSLGGDAVLAARTAHLHLACSTQTRSKPHYEANVISDTTTAQSTVRRTENVFEGGNRLAIAHDFACGQTKKSWLKATTGFEIHER